MFGLADPGNKPLSSAKVKRRARMTAARQCGTLCERDHIAAGWRRPRKQMHARHRQR